MILLKSANPKVRDSDVKNNSPRGPLLALRTWNGQPFREETGTMGKTELGIEGEGHTPAKVVRLHSQDRSSFGAIAHPATTNPSDPSVEPPGA